MQTKLASKLTKPKAPDNVYQMTQLINVAFSGSGLLFPMHIGAYKAILDNRPKQVVRAASGTSGGAIVAALVACGYTVEEMEKLLSEIDLRKMIEFNFKALFNMGYCDGKRALKTLESIFGDVTMAETKLPLYITASDVHKGEPVVISKYSYPDMPVALAVRASMSIPFVFSPVRYKGMTLVDGMLYSSTPFTVFRYRPGPVYGIALRSSSDKQYMSKTHFFPSYALRIFELVLQGVNRMHITLSETDDAVILCVIEADTYDVLGDYPKEELVQYGYNKTQEDLLTMQ